MRLGELRQQGGKPYIFLTCEKQDVVRCLTFLAHPQFLRPDNLVGYRRWMGGTAEVHITQLRIIPILPVVIEEGGYDSRSRLTGN